jgi:septin family protein
LTYTQEELDSFRLLIKMDLKRKNNQIYRECSFAQEAILIEKVLQTNLMNKTDFGDLACEVKDVNIG